MMKAVCYSHIGERPTHEDNFLFYGNHISQRMQQQMREKRLIAFSSDYTTRINFFAVSDGMGGHNAGEVASRICVEKLAELEKPIQNCVAIKEAVALLQSAIAEINGMVCELSRRHEELKGMGATLVLLLVFGKDCAILNVGDSRAYHFDGNVLAQLTKDNTEGQRMIDLGLLTRKELINFPARKNLSRYIGYNQNGFILQADEYYPILDKGRVLLCSDGVSDFLSDRQIADVLRSESDITRAGKQIIEQAVADNHADNATVILLEMGR